MSIKEGVIWTGWEIPPLSYHAGVHHNHFLWRSHQSKPGTGSTKESRSEIQSASVTLQQCRHPRRRFKQMSKYSASAGR